METVRNFYDANAFYAWLAVSFLVCLLLLWVLMLHARLRKALRHYHLLVDGVDGDNLENVLDRQISQAYETAQRLEDLSRFSRELDRSLRHAIQRVGIVRFNPFNDTGGDQSFAVALLDASGSGIVLTSIFSRKESRLYAKPVQRGSSRYPLSDEEREAIQQAIDERVPAGAG